MKKELLLNSEVQPAIIPQNDDGNAAVAGSIYDLTKFESALVFASVGAVTGTPTDLDVTVTIYTGDDVDDEDAPTSITDEAATTYVLTLSGVQAGSATDFMNVDLSGLKKWGRVDVELGFTGGTTPTADIDAIWVFGDPAYSEEVTDAENVGTYLEDGEQ